METVSIGIQVQPDTDNHETSTEDILVKRYGNHHFFSIHICVDSFWSRALVMRIHRPIGILKAQFQCVVHAQGRVYKTSVFNLNVFVLYFFFDVHLSYYFVRLEIKFIIR